MSNSPSPSNHQQWAWVGKHYAEGWDGIRVLVLGESSYGTVATPPRVLIEHYLASSARWHNTYTRFLKILTGQTVAPDREQRKNLWDRLAFTNYLTSAAGSKAGDRPSKTQWGDSLPNFVRFLGWLNPTPTVVIVWGMSLWNALEHDRGCKQCVQWNHQEGTGYIHWPHGQPIPAVGIAHPAYPASSNAKWRKHLNDFMDIQRSRRLHSFTELAGSCPDILPVPPHRPDDLPRT